MPRAVPAILTMALGAWAPERAAFAQTPAAPAPSTNQRPSSAPPSPATSADASDATQPEVADPARLRLPPDATGVVLVTIKADKVADYDAVLAAMHEALLKTTDAALREQARGWRVYKAREADAKAAAIYVHVITAPVQDADYRPSAVLSQLVESLSTDLLVKYRDAFAGAPTMLSLDEVRAFGGPLPPPRPATPASTGSATATPAPPAPASSVPSRPPGR